MANRGFTLSGLQQLFKLQRRAFEYVMGSKADAKLIPEYIRAWAVLEERKRILQGKALPGEELRASATGAAVRAMSLRKLRKMPAFAFVPPAQVVDAKQVACGVEPTTGSVPVERKMVDDSTSAQVPPIEPVA